MPTTLFFDTETTGLVKDRYPPTHSKQPMPMQIGMKLDTHDRDEVGVTNFLVQPQGWHIEPKASEITGITDALAEKYGVHFITAIESFLDYKERADVLVAHNAAFDVTVMRRAVFVYSHMIGDEYVDPFKDTQVICTMLAALPIVKATPKRRGQWKWPKLEECVNHFYNETIEGAHDALVDVKACARVFYTLTDLGVFNDNYQL